MSQVGQYDYYLIREEMVLVRVPGQQGDSLAAREPQFFDVRTGVQLKGIHPPYSPEELERGHRLTEEHAHSIIKSGNTMLVSPLFDASTVVSILDMRQRKLDSVVADSILDQLQVVCGILSRFLQIAREAEEEERFWLSQQVLTSLRKFSGRELAELEEIMDWFASRPKKG
jgi:hypothetical protein